MSRCLCSAPRLVPESRGQQLCHPLVHLLGESWISMHRKPDVLSIAPDVIGQTYGHRWSAQRAPLAQALMWHHKVVEADHDPDLPPVTSTAPGQTPGAAPQGRNQSSQGAIPAFHEGRLNRLSELPQAQLLAKTARATIHDPPADLNDVASLVADLDHLGVEQGLRSHKPGLRLAAHLPTPPGTIHDAHDLEQRCRVGLPSIGEKQRKLSSPRDDLRDKSGGCILRAWAKVDPEQKPTSHGQCRMHPFYLLGTEFRMGLIQLYALHLYVLHALSMVRLGSLGSQGLKAMDGLEIHGTNIRCALITDAPALTLQEPFYGRFGELAAGHQGPRPLRELLGANGTAQPFDMLMLARPRAMDNVACAGAVEPHTLWIRTRESCIALLRWRRQYHNGPPVAGNGPQDTDSTPVVPCYYSPGLPFIVLLLVFLAIVIVRFSVAYLGFYRLDPSYFLSSTTVNAGTLGYYEFVILSLNNLPLAAAAGHAVSLMCRVI
jgi:hypothetical protein